MLVDDYKFLPRMLRSLYEDEGPIEEGTVWAPFRKRLSDAKIGMVTSAGLHLETQQPFDTERERREPLWGDSSYRRIPQTGGVPLDISHLHIKNDDIMSDPNIALPRAPLDRLVESGIVGAASEEHFSVMGYQGWSDSALDRWRDETAPAIADGLKASQTDGVVMVPV